MSALVIASTRPRTKEVFQLQHSSISIRTIVSTAALVFLCVLFPLSFQSRNCPKNGNILQKPMAIGMWLDPNLAKYRPANSRSALNLADGADPEGFCGGGGTTPSGLFGDSDGFGEFHRVWWICDKEHEFSICFGANHHRWHWLCTWRSWNQPQLQCAIARRHRHILSGHDDAELRVPHRFKLWHGLIVRVQVDFHGLGVGENNGFALGNGEFFFEFVALGYFDLCLSVCCLDG